ncbi:MAG TPA: hypothetical protein DCM86_05165 [Verrucomicrobiales bacterium]|nr:hypothetical protein [Verrucomicrobiales bacterium]
MRSFLAPNIGRAGRWIRGTLAIALLVGAGFGYQVSGGLGTALLLSGLFVLYEALRGWCVVRACGIKTRF